MPARGSDHALDRGAGLERVLEILEASIAEVEAASGMGADL
jgi:hypothetical protein